MPLPNPGEKEEKSDFVSRCMGNPTMVSEFEDISQRRAVCESQWDRRKQSRKEEYNCECIKCGHKMTTEEHCVDLKCPKCGGEMRRAERPGAGRDLAKDGIQFFKEDTKKQIAYGIVWEPGFVDAHGEWASPEDIMEAAHDYLAYHRGIKLSHGMNIAKEANIVESYLAPIDFECNGYTIKEGSWIVGIKVLDKDYWEGIESGLIVGLSAGGTKTFVEGGDA